MTKLREYLFYNNISVKDFADAAGVSRVYMSLISRGTKIPSKLLAKEIERMTDGKVKAIDMRPLR